MQQDSISTESFTDAKGLDDTSRSVRNARQRSIVEGIREHLFELVGEKAHQISVKKESHWYIFQGSIDSYETKRKIFSTVPLKNGARWIIDNLQIGRPIGAAS